MYSSLRELSLAKWVDIEETGDVWLLDKCLDPITGISSNPIPMDVLHNRWDELKIDFFNSINSASLKDNYKLQIEGTLYNLKYEVIQKVCDLLELKRSEESEQILAELGYRINSKLDDEKYKKELKSIRVRSKSLLARATAASNMLNKKFANLNNTEKSEDNGNVWLNILVNIGIANTTYYKPSDITCYDFIELYKSAMKRASKNNEKK